MVHGPGTLAVSQTVSQNREFDLLDDSAKILIRSKVRTKVVPQGGVELRPRAPFLLIKTLLNNSLWILLSLSAPFSPPLYFQ